MPNVTEQIASEVITHTINLLRVSQGMLQPILRDLNALEKELIRDLENYVGKSSFTITRLKALLKQTRDTIATSYNQIAVANEQGLIQIAKITGTQTAAAINAAIGASVVSVGVSKAQLIEIAKDTIIQGALTKDWWTRKENINLADKFAQQMRMGQLRGEGIEELVRRVRGTKAMGFKDGIMNLPKHRAEALVRTSVLGVSNSARMATYAANPEVIAKLEWISVLDSKTSPQCQALDLKTWRIPKDDPMNYSAYEPIGHDKEFSPPPIHWNCRSTTVPITYSWEELSAMHGNSKAVKIAKKVPEGKRASMDGSVAESLTFTEWLKGKSPAFQDSVLGKAKAELFRSGQLNDLSDLTDTRNRPLTLAQLTGGK